MAKQDEVLVGLCEILKDVHGTPADSVQMDKSFRDDLGVDSLTMLEIATLAEDTYNIRLVDDELEQISTVGDAVNVITEKAS